MKCKSRFISKESVVVRGPQGPQGPRGFQGPPGQDGSSVGVIGPAGPTGPQGNEGATGPRGREGPAGLRGPAGMDGAIGPTGPASTVAGPAGPKGAKGEKGDSGSIAFTSIGTFTIPTSADTWHNTGLAIPSEGDWLVLTLKNSNGSRTNWVKLADLRALPANDFGNQNSPTNFIEIEGTSFEVFHISRNTGNMIRIYLENAFTGVYTLTAEYTTEGTGGGGGGSSSFTGLSDTPGSFTGQAGKFLKTNAGETALEFTDAPTGGSVGPAGPKGDKGDTGNTGPQGPKGDQGIQGIPGQDGADGAKGDPGPAGAIGPAGVTGPQGLTGEQGPQGPKGDTGSAGPKGDTGSAGPAGPKGDKGDQGEAPTTGTSRGMLVGTSTALPTTAVPRGTNLSPGAGGVTTGDDSDFSYTYWWVGAPFSRGYTAQSHAGVSNRFNPTLFFPPPNPPSDDVIGLQFRTKVGSVYVQSANILWGPGGLTTETTGAKSDITELSLIHI